MAGMTLKTSASYFLKDTFEAWDASTNTFSGEIPVRLHRADRFKTIYHRPTKRQKISVMQGVSLPSSGVIRHTATNEVFLTSVFEETEIWQGQEVYEKLVTLHRAEPLSGGYAEFRPVTVSGSGDNLGAVSYSVPEHSYAELELRTVGEESGSLEVDIGQMTAHLSRNVLASPGDFLIFGGDYYRIVFPYSDSGFRAARLVKEDPNYQTITYKLDTGTAGYNPVTGAFSQGTQDRLVSALIGDAQTERDRQSSAYNRMLSLYIYQAHIGFPPKVGDKIVHDGTTYEILKVTENQRELQWRVEVGL